MWSSFALGFMSLAIPGEDAGLSADREEFLFVILVMGIIAALVIWVYIAVWQGRNWARIVALILTGLSLLAIVNFAQDFAERPIGSVVDIVTTLFDVTAMVLLFGPGRAWFRARS